MSGTEACPKCGSRDVMDGVRIVDGGLEEKVKVEVQRRPHAMLFKGTVGVALTARVCGACGFTELFASDPARLVEARSRSA